MRFRWKIEIKGNTTVWEIQNMKAFIFFFRIGIYIIIYCYSALKYTNRFLSTATTISYYKR